MEQHHSVSLSNLLKNDNTVLDLESNVADNNVISQDNLTNKSNLCEGEFFRFVITYLIIDSCILNKYWILSNNLQMIFLHIFQ